MSKRINLLSATARVPALLLSVAAAGAFAQFSPGPLSKAHSGLAGPARCTSCHVMGAGERSFRCLECHTEIGRRLKERRGLHATLVKRTATQEDCVRCHVEHVGEDYVPIRWESFPKAFDHAKAGFVLEGAHSRLACAQCHTPRFIPASEKPNILVKDHSRTYLGLARACTACHEDKHRGQLGTRCAECHNQSAWRPASGFEHSRARFVLAGAHAKVACEKCHRVAGPNEPVKFRGVAFATCQGCHTDPHRGSFKGSCESCHSVHAWKPVRMSTAFDHSRTAFALEGKHAGVTCEKCHRTSNFKQPVAHGRCLDCHSPDAHRGQFVARADGGECSACHTVGGWKPSTFTLAAHTTARYPLEGRHARLDCAKCHRAAGPATVYRGTAFDACTACHTDPHKGQFAGAPNVNRCERCHTVEGFHPSTFTLAQHRQSRFPLPGAHAAVPCAECHSGGAAAKFRFNDLACAACHKDPHSGQFREVATKPADCERCHASTSWRDVTRFDHAATKFPLAGAHRAVACGACHRPAEAGGGIRTVAFRFLPTDCAGCHQDVHGGQFAAAPGGQTACGRCHGPLRWKPSLFDHDRDSSYSLAGAHRGVACTLCHKTSRQVKGRNVLFYKPTPRECSDCHGPDAKT